jgi:hypothetical protein
MAEQKYVLMKVEDLEPVLALADESSIVLLDRVYGHLTGASFLDEKDYWEIDPEEALKVAMELYERLCRLERVVRVNTCDYTDEPYYQFVYTESKIRLLKEDWD